MFSLIAAEMLMGSDNQAHPPDEIGAALKNPRSLQLSSAILVLGVQMLTGSSMLGAV